MSVSSKHRYAPVQLSSSAQRLLAMAQGAPVRRPFAWAQTFAIAVLMGLASAFATAPAHAQAAVDPTPIQFNDSAEEARFHALVSELRCVMCQNQSLADSNAQIAVDLRHEVLALMRQGKTNTEIKDFLVARYGEFVLYRPQVESKTWLLWFGPAVVLLAGGLVVVGIVRRRSVRQRGSAPGSTARNTPANAAEDDQEW